MTIFLRMSILVYLLINNFTHKTMIILAYSLVFLSLIIYNIYKIEQEIEMKK